MQIVNNKALLNLIAENAVTSTDAASDMYLSRLRHQGAEFAYGTIKEIIQDGSSFSIKTVYGREYMFDLTFIQA